MNCAGQGCGERELCRRYLIRLASKRWIGDERQYDWASWDLERLVFGDCKMFIQWRVD